MSGAPSPVHGHATCPAAASDADAGSGNVEAYWPDIVKELDEYRRRGEQMPFRSITCVICYTPMVIAGVTSAGVRRREPHFRTEDELPAVLAPCGHFYCYTCSMQSYNDNGWSYADDFYWESGSEAESEAESEADNGAGNLVDDHSDNLPAPAPELVSQGVFGFPVEYQGMDDSEGLEDFRGEAMVPDMDMDIDMDSYMDMVRDMNETVDLYMAEGTRRYRPPTPFPDLSLPGSPGPSLPGSPDPSPPGSPDPSAHPAVDASLPVNSRDTSDGGVAVTTGDDVPVHELPALHGPSMPDFFATSPILGGSNVPMAELENLETVSAADGLFDDANGVHGDPEDMLQQDVARNMTTRPFRKLDCLVCRSSMNIPGCQHRVYGLVLPYFEGECEFCLTPPVPFDLAPLGVLHQTALSRVLKYPGLNGCNDCTLNACFHRAIDCGRVIRNATETIARFKPEDIKNHCRANHGHECDLQSDEQHAQWYSPLTIGGGLFHSAGPSVAPAPPAPGEAGSQPSIPSGLQRHSFNEIDDIYWYSRGLVAARKRDFHLIFNWIQRITSYPTGRFVYERTDDYNLQEVSRLYDDVKTTFENATFGTINSLELADRSGRCSCAADVEHSY